MVVSLETFTVLQKLCNTISERSNKSDSIWLLRVGFMVAVKYTSKILCESFIFGVLQLTFQLKTMQECIESYQNFQFLRLPIFQKGTKGILLIQSQILQRKLLLIRRKFIACSYPIKFIENAIRTFRQKDDVDTKNEFYRLIYLVLLNQ